MSNLQAVPFHNHNLFLTEYDGQPYTPMKPIVSGMGLDWKSQYAKLKANAKRWGMVIITTPSKGGIQSMASMPLRKLPAFLCSIHSSKVKPELRETIEFYQDECDNALWDYWSKGHAVNPRVTINPAQQHIIQEKVKALAADNKAYPKYYGAIKRHFKIAKYDQLLAKDFDEALEVLQGVVVEQKAVEEEQPKHNDMALRGMVQLSDMVYERHQAISMIQTNMDMVKASLEVLQNNLSQYEMKMNDPVRELQMFGSEVKRTLN